MERKGWYWVILVCIIVVSAYVVPFIVLRNVDAWYGSFLYWVLFALVSIWINMVITRKWRD